MKLFAYALSAFLVSLSALGATTGTLILQGIVGTTYSISVASQTGAMTLDILNGESAKLVGVATETSNNGAGYKVTMSSANNGELKNSTLDQVQYKVSYNGGTAVTPSSTAAVVKTSSVPQAAGVTSNIAVTFTGKPTAVAGTYSDTLTLTIAAP